MNTKNLGILYVVATPIGNLQDMGLRAIEVLKAVDWIAAEDTRHSLPLLKHFSISTPQLSLHEHNERESAAKLLEHLQKGEDVALISDAGTPLISDPGYFLVREAKKLRIRVIPIPGACAAIAALSVSGFATDRFLFEGFLPAKSNARLNRLKDLQQETRTMIFYEAPHRILNLLEDMQSVFGKERQVVIARELTKIFETVRSGTFSEILEWVQSDANQQRGEIVVLVEGSETSPFSGSSQKVLTLLLEELPLKKAAEIAAKITGERKNDLYELGLKLKVEK